MKRPLCGRTYIYIKRENVVYTHDLVSLRHLCTQTNSHVLHSDVLQDLAVVDVPDGLVVPDFGGQQDGSQDHALPVGRADVQLGVGQQALQVNLHADRCRNL